LIKLFKFSVKFLITAAALALIFWFVWKYAIPKLEQKDSRNKTEYEVTKVFDGDTFEVLIAGKREKVRMLGIDTPESYDSDKLNRDAERTKRDKAVIKRLGKLSTDFTKSLIENKKVLLETRPEDDEKDRYGRLLRYVYLKDGTFVNKKIVEQGYAVAFRKFKVYREKELIEAEKEARINKRGLWGEVEGLRYMEGSTE
jgi:micrococcal nuclease